MNEVMAVIEKLEAGEGELIGAAAVSENLPAEVRKAAYKVVEWYDFMRKCPGDPGGQMFFLLAYEEWGRVARAV